MTAEVRRAVFLIAALIFAGFLSWGLVDLAGAVRFEDLAGAYYPTVAVEQVKSYNVVSAVVFDYRGADTMIEVLLLYAAVLGVDLLLRRQRGERLEPPRRSLPERDVPHTAAALQLAGVVFAGASVFVAMYVILHAQFTPGGGFQSGVVLASAVLASYIADEYTTFDRLAPIPALERIESVSAGAYLVVGAIGLALTGHYMANFLPHGELGTLLSSGTIAFLNTAVVGVEVTAGFILIFYQFLQQTIQIREREQR